MWGQDSRDKVLKCEIYQGSSQNLAIVFILHIDLFCLWPPKSHKRSQGINEYKVVRLGIVKHILLAYTSLVAGANISDLTKWAAQLVSAPINIRVTMTGSCYDLLDEQNLAPQIPTRITQPSIKRKWKNRSKKYPKETIRVIDYRLSFIAIHCSVYLVDWSNSASAAANSRSVDLVLYTRSDLIILSRCW